MEDELLEILKKEYQKDFIKLDVIRDWIGKVYLLEDSKQKYVLKLFRTEHTEDAIQSTEIMKYVRNKGVQVPEIYQTATDKLYFMFEKKAAVLYEYIDGKEIDGGEYLREIGSYSGMMRSVMPQITFLWIRTNL